MAPSSTITVLLLLGVASTASAQSTTASNEGQTTWGTVVYTFHGEKTPDLAYSGYNLSPLGANQLLQAGSVIRDRYVAPPDNGTNITNAAPINGLSSEIDNSQLSVISTDDEFVSGSALAFMQGLYPPTILEPESYLSNSTYLQYPLGGYQYPNIGTVNALDFDYIWIAGNEDCTTYSMSQVDTLSSDAYEFQVANTSSFYNNLSSTVFAGLSPAIVNYYNAYELYEYALYQYNHNSSASQALDVGTLSRLQNLASQQQFETNTPNSEGTIAAIAGNTFAAKVLQQFNQIVASSGVSDKMTLLFGSYEPFLSFFALSNLSVGPSASKFNSLPVHGSVMVFELFSYTGEGNSFNASATFPTTDDLWVRFLFRNGTSDTEELISYPLFGRGNSQVDMTWDDFVTGMGDFSLNEVSDWCTSCQSINLFCEAIWTDIDNGTSSSTNGNSHEKKLSPVIGGVIGATVTIGLFIICAIVLILFGFRLDYHEKRAKGVDGSEGGIGVLKRNGSAGGFKGAEKLASDTDLRLKSGAGATIVRHERVGSWELNESPTSPTDRKHSSLDKEIERGRVVSTADYGRHSEDGIGNINPFGDPVKPVDHV